MLLHRNGEEAGKIDIGPVKRVRDKAAEIRATRDKVMEMLAEMKSIHNQVRHCVLPQPGEALRAAAENRRHRFLRGACVYIATPSRVCMHLGLSSESAAQHIITAVK